MNFPGSLECRDLFFLNELVVRQSQAGRNVFREAEDIVEIRHQATTGEDAGD
jgi:hypothetical protein